MKLGGRSMLQLAAQEDHQEAVPGACQRFHRILNGTENCAVRNLQYANALSICGKCREPQGPDLDFSWGSEFQRSFRDMPLEPEMSCHGLRDFTRSCYFRDILWDLQEEKWVVFGEFSEVLGGMGAVLKEGEPWLRLDRCAAALSL